MGVDVGQYCRQIEAHVCTVNDGHLMRIVGPAFETVLAWATDGIPLPVACAGIDRAADRLQRKPTGSRRLRVEYCDRDVREVFDEWRRATGVTAAGSRDVVATSPPGNAVPPAASSPRLGASLPDHLTRVLLRLTQMRVDGRLDAEADALLTRASDLLDRARTPGGVRGTARATLLTDLAVLDADLVAHVHARLSADQQRVVDAQADAALAPYLATMHGDARARARRAAVATAVRAVTGLPVVTHV